MTWWNLQIWFSGGVLPWKQRKFPLEEVLPTWEQGSNPTELNATETEVAKSASGSLSMAVSNGGLQPPGLLGLCRCSWMQCTRPKSLPACPKSWDFT